MAVTLFEDFQEIVAGGGVERFNSPVVEDEQIGASERAQEAWIAAIAACQREIPKQPGHALVKNRSVVATGLVAERTGEPTLADAGWADERQIIVGVDPFTPCKFLEQGAIQTARITIVDIFDTGLLAQFGVTQPRHEALVLSPRCFAIKQQGETFAMAQALPFAAGIEFAEGFGHAMQAKDVKLVESGMIEQDEVS